MPNARHVTARQARRLPLAAGDDGGRIPLEVEVGRLADLDLDGLRTRWRNETGRAAPHHLPRGLLLRLVAYRMQAERLGDLDPATARFLARVAAGGTVRGAIPLPDGERVRPGAVLVREWDGVSHRVMALAEGFSWNGETYASLSEVARAITGTRWNGPRFFGLRRRAAADSTVAPLTSKSKNRVSGDERARPAPQSSLALSASPSRSRLPALPSPPSRAGSPLPGGPLPSRPTRTARQIDTSPGPARAGLHSAGQPASPS